MTPALDPIETLCALDAAGRGIGRLVVPGAMAAAARSLARATRVALVTGFVPRPEWAAETDGPSGTVVLGRAVRQLGAEVVYVADPPVLPLLEGCLKALGEPLDVVAVPAEPAAAVAAARMGLAHRAARVRLPGGELEIRWEGDGRVLMSGPVREVFRGTLDLDAFGA